MSQIWIIKNNAPVDAASYSLETTNISFTTNKQKATSFGIVKTPDIVFEVTYGGIGVIGRFDPITMTSFTWDNEAYKTLEFDTAPTGELLAWLQKNADKQVDTEYLTRKSELTSIADAIRTKSGTSTPLIYPSGFVSTIQSIDITGGLKPATLTISSSADADTGNVNGRFIFINSEGHIAKLNYMSDTFTYPITIKTVIGGMVVLEATGPRDSYRYTGCEVTGFQSTVYILVTSPQASADIYNPGD